MGVGVGVGVGVGDCSSTDLRSLALRAWSQTTLA